ncbi:hypothetical protein HYH03_014681 [Edaphochlamys debaryana]|uniref:Protein kinase domain-containing protein n=1 Tax=Edaphochlamys debaryana TaxID=47281 RepID=A0A836BT96_9CHLO|nr:hypothetical protein HYH03_014681 [Edaphochlamys debaryana]|eukprot:KAG2486624.1 hypothetical protein HYH03_014681 [Edaphochlamys debaryana]
MSDEDWGAIATPVRLRRDTHVCSEVTQGLDPPLLDWAFVRDKVEIANGVAFSFEDVAFARYRADGDDPGLDLLTTSTTLGPPGLLELTRVTHVGTLCLPCNYFIANVEARMIRKNKTAGQWNDVSQQGCDRDPSAPRLLRCWASRTCWEGDMALQGMHSKPGKEGRPLYEPANYHVHLVDSCMLCERVMPGECVKALGPQGCMKSQMDLRERALPQVPAAFPSSAAPDGGRGNSPADDDGVFGGPEAPMAADLPRPAPAVSSSSPQVPAFPSSATPDGDGDGGEDHTAVLAGVLGGVLGGVALLTVLAGLLLAFWGCPPCGVPPLLVKRGHADGSTRELPRSCKSGEMHAATQYKVVWAISRAQDVTWAKTSEPSGAAGHAAGVGSEEASDEGRLPSLPPAILHPVDPSVPVTLLTPPRPDLRWLGAMGNGREVKLLPDATLGKGSFGRVIEGVYQGRRVAVKVVSDAHQFGGPGESLIRSFAQEVEVLGRCTHPNVVRLLAACLTPPRLCLVMELMETSLDRLLYGKPESAPLPLPTVLHISLEVAKGLEYLHPTITHRDLKPGNVLLNDPHSPRPTVKLADFGLSRLRSTVVPTVTPDAGTPAYLAPEGFDAANYVITHQADMYSLAVLVWEMLAGSKPWQGCSLYEVAHALTTRGARLPLDSLPEARCPPRLRALLQQCWERDPRRRPAAAEAVKALALALLDLERGKPSTLRAPLRDPAAGHFDDGCGDAPPRVLVEVFKAGLEAAGSNTPPQPGCGPGNALGPGAAVQVAQGGCTAHEHEQVGGPPLDPGSTMGRPELFTMAQQHPDDSPEAAEDVGSLQQGAAAALAAKPAAASANGDGGAPVSVQDAQGRRRASSVLAAVPLTPRALQVKPCTALASGGAASGPAAAATGAEAAAAAAGSSMQGTLSPGPRAERHDYLSASTLIMSADNTACDGLRNKAC